MTPARTSCEINAGVVRSGASVTSVLPILSEVSNSIAFVQPAQLRCVVYAAALGVEIGPFDMNAECAGYARSDGLACGRDRAREHVQVVADERGQESDGAEASMCTADLGDRSDARRVVEQHAAAAVDLRVDKAGDRYCPRRS